LIEPVVLPVKLAVHVVEAPLPLSVQVVVVGDTPAPLAVSVIVPVGAVAPTDVVSVTVTMQLLATPATTGLVQLTPVVVVCAVTVNEPVPELVACVPSLL
jgi:hypothetical protein